MNQTDYHSILRAAVSLRDKHILELGGAVPPDLIGADRVASWTSIDISRNRFAVSLGEQNLPPWYRTHLMSATELTFDDNHFDIVYSTNCFEHIDDIAAAFGHIYRVLKPGGILFTIFAPIWSSPVGHHTWVWDGDKPVTFQQGVFPHWFHLTKSEVELRLYLKDRYKPEVVESILRYVYHSQDINRLVDSDYEREIDKYDYARIICYWLKARRAPTGEQLLSLREKYGGVRSFRTLGYFWILAKEQTSLQARLRAYVRGGGQVLWRKLRPRLVNDRAAGHETD